MFCTRDDMPYRIATKRPEPELEPVPKSSPGFNYVVLAFFLVAIYPSLGANAVLGVLLGYVDWWTVDGQMVALFASLCLGIDSFSTWGWLDSVERQRAERCSP